MAVKMDKIQEEDGKEQEKHHQHQHQQELRLFVCNCGVEMYLTPGSNYVPQICESCRDELVCLRCIDQHKKNFCKGCVNNTKRILIVL